MKKKILKFSVWFISILCSIILVLGFVFLKPLDTSHYQQNEYYKKTIQNIDNNTDFISENSSDTVYGSWSKVSLIPPFRTPIAIDASRKGKLFEGINDSIFVRCFVFQQGQKKIAYISADLLIIPPIVSEILDTLLLNEGYSLQNIYLTATHTHASIGAWHNSAIGELFAGKYDARVPMFIAQQIKTAIINASEHTEPLKIGYETVKTHKLVFNRLLENIGDLDSLMRIVVLEKKSGKKACLITFTAHATCLHDKVMKLSGDWPGLMMQKIDSSKKVELCVFSAGSVGSHGPYKCKKDKWDELNFMTNRATKYVFPKLDSIPLSYMHHIHMVHQPILMREPNYRMVFNLVLRQKWFYKYFGKKDNYINMLSLDQLVFAGMPCDFSGEMDDELDLIAKNQYKKLLITSFNGCFVGYITDDRRYGMNAYETKTMNWYGPENGAYFSELITRMMKKM